ncbi:hypothetical protein [Arenibacter sp. F20364]|uniref:hypothetical protein n=1 Tax=Arenibacter sp. F20364 TaxID=2926415 RepID=UPI001FF1A12A|nr:hypothetical protein [Arenibacter sp. F20364]MCK0191462.1 hypothetical protein [Arenibacter sp. F20364]
MTLKNALQVFESLVSKTNKKSEIKVYQEFIQIINSLEQRNLSAAEIAAIQAKLTAFNLESDPKNRIKFFKKALGQFKKYLKDYLSLTSKGYYSSLGIGLGMNLGILFGIVILSGLERSLGISLGISLGMIFGLIIGQSMDAKATREDKVL